MSTDPPTFPRSAGPFSLGRPVRPGRRGASPCQDGAHPVRPVRCCQGRRADQDRRRPRRRGLDRGPGDPAALRMAAGRQYPVPRQDGMPGDLRPPEPLHRVPVLRPRAAEDPGPPHGPRRYRYAHPRRSCQLHDRFLQRRTARLPVPGQPHGRPSRRQFQRVRRLRGFFVGRHLERGRQDHRLGLGRRGGHPAQPAPLPQLRRPPDLGFQRGAVMAPGRPAPHDVSPALPER